MEINEMFKRVASHLMTMEKQAFVDGVGCSYLTDDGNKCAVGCLIPDGHAGQMSSYGVGVLLRDYPDLAELFGIDTDAQPRVPKLQMLHDLQVLHDDEDLWDDNGLNEQGVRGLLEIGQKFLLDIAQEVSA